MVTSAKRVSAAEWKAVEVGPVVGIDFETFYSAGYSVDQMGNWAYCHDPRFKVWAVSVSDGAHTCVCMPADFPWETIDRREWVSHNREFDEAVFLRLVELGVIWRGLVLRPRAWHCSAALCAFLQYPRSLADASLAVLGLSVDKGVRSRARGRDVGPDLFGQSQVGAAYAATDAETCLALWQALESRWPSHERRLYGLTCDMGRIGLAVDWARVVAFGKTLREIVGSCVSSLPYSPALSTTAFYAACDKAGVSCPPSTAADDPRVQDWAHENQRSDAVTWLRLMQQIRSVNRLEKVLSAMELRRKPSGRMAYELKYFGASTGRWSGGGGLNLQNYNRKAVEGVDLRRCIMAPPGFKLAVVDYSQIESRVLLFLAGDVETLDLFRANPKADAYEIHARATMGYAEAEPLRAYCERTGSGLRQLAKARVLGLGFGCGARRFVEVAQVMAGLEITEYDAERIVAEFRATNSKILRLWSSLHDACAACDGGDYVLPLPCTQANPLCGRYLFYRNVRFRNGRIQCVVGGNWVDVYGGLLAENWTQATARDLLASAWLRCESAGFGPVLSVHDELVFEVPETSAAADLAEIVSIFETPVAWAPGLPLRADGKLCDVYGK